MKLWPFNRERREAGGDLTSTVIALAEAQAMGKAADTGRTAALEAAAGALEPGVRQRACTGR